VIKMVLATGNQGKVREIAAYFEDAPIELVSQANFLKAPVDETGETFVENALLKARAASKASGLSAMADDSGLVVPALGGIPGVKSARYGGPDATAKHRYMKLLTAMADLPEGQRGAYFHCALVWLRHAKDPSPIVVQAQWHGEITVSPVGEGGFGYDPVFYVPTEGCTAAEMSDGRKNQISHRGQAMQLFCPQLFAEFELSHLHSL